MITSHPANKVKDRQNWVSHDKKEAGLLTETALKFLELPADKDIYPLIGKTFKKICGKDVIVVVSEKRPDAESFRLKSLCGLGPLSSPITAILGVCPSAISCDFNESTKQYLASGRLNKFHGGLKELARGVFSTKGINQISRLLDVTEIYIIGLVKQKSVQGAAVLISRKQPAGFNFSLIETYAAQAAIAIERRQVELRVRESVENYKRLFERSNSVLNTLINDAAKKKGKKAKARFWENRLIQVDKMATLGVLMGGVAHEINNPNNFIMLNSELISKIWQDAVPVLDRELRAEGELILGNLPYSRYRQEISVLIKGITEGSHRIQKIVNCLQDYARQDTGDMHAEIDVGKLIESSVLIVSSLINKSTRNFSYEYSKLPAVWGNFQQLVQVIINLLINACHGLSNKQATISLMAEKTGDEQGIRITVRDESKCSSQKEMKRIFDPLYFKKQDLGDTDLRLSVSREIINRHGGKLEFTSKQGSGTIANLILPAFNKNLQLNAGYGCSSGR